MKENLNNETLLREYLLGRITDEETLGEIEELLFLNEDYCSFAAITEDALLDDLVFERLNEQDAADLRMTLENNRERRERARLAGALKTRAVQPAAEPVRSSFFDALGAFVRQPLYAGPLLIFVIVVVIGSILFLRPGNNDELANLKNIYSKERPVETRLSTFDHAPLSVTRGTAGDDAARNAIELEKMKALQAVLDDPSAVNLHRLGVFRLTQQDYLAASKDLAKAVSLDETNARFHNDLGAAFFELAKNGNENRLLNLGNANESFSRAIELAPNLLEAIFNKALTLQEMRLKNQAKEMWEIYLQKDPASKWADEARRNLEKTDQLESGSKKTKEQITTDLFAAYRDGDQVRLQKINNSTKGMLNGSSPSELLTRRYLEAQKAKDAVTANESIDALKRIGELEQEKYGDFFFSDLADAYAKTDDAQIDNLLKAKSIRAAGYTAIRSSASTAIENFDESERLFLRSNNAIEARLARLWSSQTLIYVGEVAKSREQIDLLRQDSQSRRHKTITANLSYWLGICDANQRELSRAIKNTKLAVATTRETDNEYEFNHATENLAAMHYDLGETERSLESISATLGGEPYYVNVSQTWRTLNTTADLFEQLRSYSTAIDFAKESLALSKVIFGDAPGVNDSLRHLSNAYTKAGRLAEAIEISNVANDLALGREANPQNTKVVAETFLTRAEQKRLMGRCEEALTDYQAALRSLSGLDEVIRDRYSLHKGQLLCFDDLGRASDFENELETVLRISEEYRQKIREDRSRQAFFENEHVITDVAVSHSLKRGDKKAAFDLVELSRARSLLEFVKADKSIAQVEEDFASVSRPLTIEQIQDRLPDRVALVEYQVLKDKLVIWLITKTGFDLTEKPIVLADLEKTVAAYRQAVIERDESAGTRELARQLYDLLMPDNLDPGSTVCVIPDKSLHQISFASLIAPSGRYLIEDLSLVYAPSSSIFILSTENARSLEDPVEKVLSIGNPRFDRVENPSLKDLPEAETEAKKIAGIYDHSTTLIGDKATKGSFVENLGKSDIVHFAGHFVLNKRSSSDSRMIFADDDLRVFELADRKLSRLKLVVLSACDTGFERFNSSEGAIGIARTFLAVGTPIVIGSHWRVDSDASHRLMISFHEKRRLEKLSSIEALRQSQLEMLKTVDLKAPYYWAAFSPTGGLATY